MSAFQYEALDAKGRRKKGVLSADNMRLAKAQLIEAGLSPMALSPVSGDYRKGNNKSVPKIAKADLAPITRQLAVIVAAGATVEEALQAVAMQYEKPAVNHTLLGVRARVMEGWRLSDALGDYKNSFSPLYRGIIAAGEQSGNLGEVLLRLATMQEKTRELQMKAITALIYPTVLVAILIMVTTGLMVFIVPKIVEQFDILGAQLPLLTRIIIAISNFLSDWGLGLAMMILIGGATLWWVLRLAGPRRHFDRVILRLPLAGKLFWGLDAARFARTTATLYASGAPLLDSLQAAKRTLINRETSARVAEAIEAVREGVGLAVALKRSKAFQPMMVHMIAAGERAGQLPAMLEKTADHLEAEFDTASTLFIRLLEPAIIVIMGVVVLTIMLAILTPMLQMNTLAAG